jgi:predicted phage terminase large subunit-like protein
MVVFSPQKGIEAPYNEGDVSKTIEFQCSKARKDFLWFRHFIRPGLLHAWWQRDVAGHLMEFWEELRTGKRPALVLQAPPQHGKTEQVTDFVAWCAGMDPNIKTIFGSYSEDLGIRVNMNLQRIYDSERFKRVFGLTRINETNQTSDSGRWMRNSSLIEYVGFNGSFRNTTVMGQINGMGLDLGVIDDPIKGRAEASSKVTRDKTWNWFTDDFFGRFSNQAGFLMIMTRWHLDDPAGRWLDHFPNTKVLRYPAIAEQDETYRRKGGALFPQMKPISFLRARKQVLTQASWESIYQQRPIAAGGDMFPVERFNVIDSVDRSQVRKSIRYIDKAGTEGGGAYTAAVLVHDMRDGTTVVEDVVRGQWGASERERRVMQAAMQDKAVCKRYSIWFEQEPGSGGKESAEASVKRFKAFDAHADKVTGEKTIRAEPYAGQVQNGNVYLIAGEWNRAFIEEHEQYPLGKYMDQVDATAGAFNKLAEALGSYDRTLSWVG